VPQADLAGALQAGLPRLHADHVGKRDLEHIAIAGTHLARRSGATTSAPAGTSMNRERFTVSDIIPNPGGACQVDWCGESSP
jgi:hypothetical protein